MFEIGDSRALYPSNFSQHVGNELSIHASNINAQHGLLP